MALPAFRAKQTSTTTGTGTLTLIAPATQFRSFATHTGSAARRVRYAIAFGSDFEIGCGEFNGASPGTLTRVTVLASSNAGALVNWGAGTKDVWLVPDLDREVYAISGGVTLAVADLGNFVHFTGSSSATINLPAVATVPPGSGYVIRNSGTSGAWLTLDASGTETIDGATTSIVFGGESVAILRSGSGWVTDGLSFGKTLVRQQVPTVTTAVDFLIPSATMRYIIEFNVVTGSNSALLFRTSTDSGSSFAAGGSDYGRAYLTSNTTTTATANSGSSIVIAETALAGAPITGSAQFLPGESGYGARLFNGNAFYADTGGSVLTRGDFAGNRVANGAVNAIRVLTSSGNFAAGGYIALYAMRT